MKIRFAKYYDVSTEAKAHSDEYKTYEKIYVCRDTKNWWITMYQKDINSEFEPEVGTYMIERNNIDFSDAKNIREVIEYHNTQWDFWDNFECSSEKECIDIIDDGMGIVDNCDVLNTHYLNK